MKNVSTRILLGTACLAVLGTAVPAHAGIVTDTAGIAGTAEWTFDAAVAGLSTTITVDAVSQAFLATEALDGATLQLLTQAVPFSTGQLGPGALVGEFMTSNFITGSETIQVDVDSAGLYNFNARWNNVGGEEQSQLFQIQFGEVPEPSSLALLGLGSLLMARRRRHA